MSNFPDDIMRRAKNACARVRGFKGDDASVRAIATALSFERERCANIAENHFGGASIEAQSHGYQIADAIRGDA